MKRHHIHHRAARGPGRGTVFGEERGMHGGHLGALGGRRQGGGHRRPFEQGDLRLLVLALIAERPRHGYELIKEIEARMGGAYAPSPGVIYPLLTLLEEMGLARLEAEEGGKKRFGATPEGQADLAANKPALDAVLARLQGAREAYAGGRSPQVVRAMENLKFALRLRMERGPVDDEDAAAIAAIIDAAAQSIDRISAK